MSTRTSRILACACAVVVAAANALLHAADPVHAAVGAGVTCTPPSSESVTFSPPLTAAPQETTVSRQRLYGPCVSLSEPAVTSGSAANVATLVIDCHELLRSGTTVIVITWNTGAQSRLEGERLVNFSAGILTVTITGTVTDGLFEGAGFIQQTAGAAPQIATCMLGLGTVSSVYGTLTLVITGALP